MSDTDAILVERCRTGDRAAFEALVTAHLPRLRAIAVAVVRNQAQTDDVVQETFFKAWTRIGQLTDSAGFAAWIACIARNEALSALRRSLVGRNTSIEGLEVVVPQSDEPDPRLAALRLALATLKPEYREILALRYDANLDYPAIGDTLGIAVANVEKRLYRARQALLAAMS